jgi:hypothetical protein
MVLVPLRASAECEQRRPLTPHEEKAVTGDPRIDSATTGSGARPCGLCGRRRSRLARDRARRRSRLSLRRVAAGSNSSPPGRRACRDYERSWRSAVRRRIGPACGRATRLRCRQARRFAPRRPARKEREGSLEHEGQLLGVMRVRRRTTAWVGSRLDKQDPRLRGRRRAKHQQIANDVERLTRPGTRVRGSQRPGAEEELGCGRPPSQPASYRCQRADGTLREQPGRRLSLSGAGGSYEACTWIKPSLVPVKLNSVWFRPENKP